MSQLFKKIVRYQGIWGITTFLDFTFPCKNAFGLTHGPLISMIWFLCLTLSLIFSPYIHLFLSISISLLHPFHSYNANTKSY